MHVCVKCKRHTLVSMEAISNEFETAYADVDTDANADTDANTNDLGLQSWNSPGELKTN